MMSDASQGKVELAQEVAYLRDYIGLLELRLDDPNFIHFNISGEISDWQIPPMLFIPFVENAYKHGKKDSPSPGIDIHLAVGGGRIVFSVTNPLKQDSAPLLSVGSGIGIQNVRRRLELLFPGRHTLKISHDATHHYVVMTIEDVKQN